MSQAPFPPELFERTEAIRQEALAYQLAHPDEDHTHGALMGELDAMVELEMLKERGLER